ncbi:hypothetical protein I3I95_00945 [bacterium]|nr:hypothetical protein [bacterium]
MVNPLRALRPRDVVPAAAVGLLAGCCIALAAAYFAAAGGDVGFLSARLANDAARYGLVMATFLLACSLAAAWWERRAPSSVGVWSRFATHVGVLADGSPHRTRLVLFAVALVAWVPAYLAFFPGNYSSDAPMQINALLNDGEIDLHWPAAHTLLLVGAFELGRSLFGSFDAGLSIYCVCQAALVAFSLAFAAQRCLAWRCPVALTLLAWLLAVLNPVVQTYAFATVKDTIFAAFFLLTAVWLVQISREARRAELSLRTLAALALCATAMCLMRKQGVYVLVLVALVLALACAHTVRVRAALLVAAAFPFLAVTGFNAAISFASGVVPDSPREILSVPSQQVARTYMVMRDSLDPALIEEIGRYYDLDAFEAGRLTDHPWEDIPGNGGAYFDTISGRGYLEPIADPAKAALNNRAFGQDKLGYARMWLDVMRGHEGIYLEAFLAQTAGYVSPSADAFNRWVGLSPFNEFGVQIAGVALDEQVSDYNRTTLAPRYLGWLLAATWDVSNRDPAHGADPAYVALYDMSVREAFRDVTALRITTHPCLPFYALCVSLVLTLRRREGRAALVACWLFCALYWCTLLLAPVMCLRYVVPLYVAMPFLLCVPLAGAERGDADDMLNG